MKKMTLFMIWLLAALPLGLAAQDKVVVNDPNAQVRDVQAFSEIIVSGSIDLYLSPGDRQTVVVSAKEETYRDRIVTRVSGNRLEIYFNEKGMARRPDMRLKAYVSFTELKKVEASGASDVFVNGVIKASKLDIHISGASDFNGAIEVDGLELHQSGSSDSKISGRAGAVEVHLSGASNMKAFDLAGDVVNIRASGASDVSVTVNRELYVSCSGASDVRYKGTGMVKETRTTGASSLKKVAD